MDKAMRMEKSMKVMNTRNMKMVKNMKDMKKVMVNKKMKTKKKKMMMDIIKITLNLQWFLMKWTWTCIILIMNITMTGSIQK